MADIMELTDANFTDSVEKNTKPVLVFVWVDWSSPCKALAPTIDTIADDNSLTLRVGKLNADNNTTTTLRYSVNSVPTILIFNKGQLVSRIVGATTKTAIQKAIDAI